MHLPGNTMVFNYSSNQALQGLSGGWAGRLPWNTQNNNNSVLVTRHGNYFLNYSGLTSLGIFGQGGSQYLTTGSGDSPQVKGPSRRLRC